MLVQETDEAAYCGSSIAAHALRLVHCGSPTVGVEAPQNMPFYTVPLLRLICYVTAYLSSHSFYQECLILVVKLFIIKNTSQPHPTSRVAVTQILPHVYASKIMQLNQGMGNLSHFVHSVGFRKKTNAVL